jgi:hypothetical protein
MTSEIVEEGAPRDGLRAARAMAILVELAPVALVVVAEAAWISVVAGLVQEFALGDPILGIPGLAVFVAAGVVLARLLGPRLGDRWPALAFGIVVGSGVVGWLISPLARAALADGVGPSLAAHPAGWVAGLAMLRGFAHARTPLAEDTVTNLLAIGIPGLAVAAMLGGLIVDPYRTRFLADSLGAAIVFVCGAVLALAFTRLDAIGFDSGFDWRRNPPWLVLTTVLLIAAIGAAIPLASMAGTVISVAVPVALGPMLILGLIWGFDSLARRLLIALTVIVAGIVVLARIFNPAPNPVEPREPVGGGLATSATTAEQIFTISIGGVLLLGAIVGIIILIALWMRRTPLPEGFVLETRTIDSGGDELEPRRRWTRFSRRPAPTTAVQAYVALVDDLDRHADVRRDPAETPSAHAARLRATGRSGLSLDFLAADYALARYGGVVLPAHEDRRAVGRWRALRSRITNRPK